VTKPREQLVQLLQPADARTMPFVKLDADLCKVSHTEHSKIQACSLKSRCTMHQHLTLEIRERRSNRHTHGHTRTRTHTHIHTNVHAHTQFTTELTRPGTDGARVPCSVHAI